MLIILTNMVHLKDNIVNKQKKDMDIVVSKLSSYLFTIVCGMVCTVFLPHKMGLVNILIFETKFYVRAVIMSSIYVFNFSCLLFRVT